MNPLEPIPERPTTMGMEFIDGNVMLIDAISLEDRPQPHAVWRDARLAQQDKRSLIEGIRGRGSTSCGKPSTVPPAALTTSTSPTFTP